jgi:hypothetical protein
MPATLCRQAAAAAATAAANICMRYAGASAATSRPFDGACCLVIEQEAAAGQCMQDNCRLRFQTRANQRHAELHRCSTNPLQLAPTHTSNCPTGH